MSSKRTSSEFLKLIGIPEPDNKQIEMLQYCKNWMIARPVIEELIKRGYSNGEIATKVGVTVDSVKWVRRISKNGVSNAHR